MQKHKGIRRSKSDRVFDVCNVVLMTLCALIMLYPLYFVAIASFRHSGHSDANCSSA